MKITRLQRIRDYRIFRDYSWHAGLLDFSRFNLVYGWNGSGKTSLSHLFKLLGERQTTAGGEFEFVVDDKVVTDKNINAALVPPIRVFNRNFVDASVFETVGKELSPIYFLGEDSAEKQKQVEALRGQLETATAEHSKARSKHDAASSEYEAFCTDQARLIRELLTAPSSSYNNYDKRNFKEAATKLKDDSYKTFLLDDEQKSKLKQTRELKSKSKVPIFTDSYPDLAGLTKEAQSLLGQSVISSVLDELSRDPSIASWVEMGLPFHADNHSETCRFCGQTLPVDRLQKLQAHFNDDFKRFQAQMADIISRVESAKIQVERMYPPEASLLYEHLTGEYQQAVEQMKSHRSTVMLYLNALRKALDAKKESPFAPVDLLPFFGIGAPNGEQMGVLGTIFSVVVAGAGVLGAFQGRQAFEKIRCVIETHNSLTDNYLNEIVKARKALEMSYVAESFEEYQRKQREIESSRQSERNGDDNVRGLRNRIAELLRAIRQHHRPAAELTNEIRAYLNRDELTFVPQENGYSLTRYGQPATNLSEGERTAIAFLYFLKSLQDTEFDMKNGVVVIDDPVSSLDANALYTAFGFMRERTKDAGQLFILTHNFTFFRMAKNWFHHVKPKKEARFYMLTSGSANGHRNAELRQLDPLLQEYESEYHYLFKRLHEEANRPSGLVELSANYGMPNIARRVLEAFLSFRVPGKAQELRQQLELVDFDSAKKARILRFLHTYSHHQQIAEPEHDLSILAETQAVLQDVLRLIEEADGQHYARMLAVINPQEDQQENGS